MFNQENLNENMYVTSLSELTFCIYVQVVSKWQTGPIYAGSSDDVKQRSHVLSCSSIYADNILSNQSLYLRINFFNVPWYELNTTS